jgi:hypothetical protein
MLLLLLFSVYRLGDVASAKCTDINTISIYTDAPLTVERLELRLVTASV